MPRKDGYTLDKKKGCDKCTEGTAYKVCPTCEGHGRMGLGDPGGGGTTCDECMGEKITSFPCPICNPKKY